MKKHKALILLILVGIVLTLLAREQAVNHRVALGLNPSWGGEFFILPMLLLMYSALKADWSVD